MHITAEVRSGNLLPALTPSRPLISLCFRTRSHTAAVTCRPHDDGKARHKQIYRATEYVIHRTDLEPFQRLARAGIETISIFSPLLNRLDSCQHFKGAIVGWVRLRQQKRGRSRECQRVA